MEATPRPWHLVFARDPLAAIKTRVYNRHGDFLCMGHHFDARKVGGKMLVNYQYMIRAVNSHDALVEACESAQYILENGVFVNTSVNQSSANAAARKVRAALALARGEEKP